MTDKEKLNKARTEIEQTLAAELEKKSVGKSESEIIEIITNAAVIPASRLSSENLPIEKKFFHVIATLFFMDKMVERTKNSTNLNDMFRLLTAIVFCRKVLIKFNKDHADETIGTPTATQPAE